MLIGVFLRPCSYGSCVEETFEFTLLKKFGHFGICGTDLIWVIGSQMCPHCILGAFTPVLRAVNLSLEHPRYVNARYEQGLIKIFNLPSIFSLPFSLSPLVLWIQRLKLLSDCRHHMADKTTVPWDWELVTSVVANKVLFQAA